MSITVKRAVEMLERRRSYLLQRSGGSWDRAEVAALTRAIRALQVTQPKPKEEEGRKT